ncbi:unnamed protein product [Acanthoscelides obtectus]|uniref:Uncharacterized protein n=1 Tax=Acanthoscelides obtectus TaxID=200917 RepID=A0A9P0JHW6_ACAOB|nr:unnamed protein product [Acanthoscelides obtectus]CAK1624895.1 hypothetical protein AOBTE_LOCUS2832 [Acanthoscelides obtectus]
MLWWVLKRVSCGYGVNMKVFRKFSVTIALSISKHYENVF